MKDHRARVREMMEGYGQDTPALPTIPDDKTLKLRCALLLEEVLEFVEAAGYEVVFECGVPGTHKFNYGSAQLKYVHAPDMIEMADAMADISVVNQGAAIALGLDLDPILDEVDFNNLLKIKTGQINPVTGKFEKHPNHTPPDILTVLEEQGWDPDES